MHGDEREATESESGHWADRMAARILAAGGETVVSTGISPSGEIHVGNLREIVTGDALVRALRSRDASPRFNFVADNFDPLRKVYPFLDAARYQPLVGRPLSDIPCPCDRHPSYAEHFLEPFLGSLAGLGIEVEVVRGDRLYRSGSMTPYVVQALEARDRIATILTELTGKDVGPEWSPFQPLCRGCGSLTAARTTGFSGAKGTVSYTCRCGREETAPIEGAGKLTWRVDWPARWMALGVTVEPFGKDHATRGGSYDTGARIVREVFGGEPPFPVPYEWIGLKGRGDMSSSKGNVLSVADALEVAPPEALRYLVMRQRPERAITLDPGLPLAQLIDELDDAATAGRDERAVELSLAGVFRPVGVPFKHLVVAAQAAGFELGRVLGILRRSGYPAAEAEPVGRRLAYVGRWLERFAPEELRFEVQAVLPEVARRLGPAQRQFLMRLAERLAEGQDGQAIHDLIYELAQDAGGLKPPQLFEAIYLSLLGKTRGPRAGSFLAMLGADFVARRFREAAAAS